VDLERLLVVPHGDKERRAAKAVPHTKPVCRNLKATHHFEVDPKKRNGAIVQRPPSARKTRWPILTALRGGYEEIPPPPIMESDPWLPGAGR